MNEGVAFAIKGGNTSKGNKKKTRTISHAISAMKLVTIPMSAQRTMRQQFLNNGENNNKEDDDYDDEDECGDCTFTNILCKQSSNVI